MTTLFRFHLYQAVIGLCRYLQTIPVSHVIYSSITVRQNILAIIPVYNLGRGSVNRYEVVVKAVVLLCRQSKLANNLLQIACILVQKIIRILPKSG